MRREYHCLVAGLPDILIDDSKLSVSLHEFKQELNEQLHEEDFDMIRLFMYRYDNENILTKLKDEEAAINTLGNLSEEDINELFILVKEGSYEDNKKFPAYLGQFISAYKEDNPLSDKVWETQLSELYYQYITGCKNVFISKWFSFEKNLNNIIAAYTCRKHDYPIENHLIGEGEIVEKLIKSSSKDFGISDEFPYMDTVMKIVEDEELLERERRVDLIKWELLDEETFFFYFTIEKIFAYFIKVSIIERWIKLDPETGKQLFNELISNLETSYSFPEEFTI